MDDVCLFGTVLSGRDLRTVVAIVNCRACGQQPAGGTAGGIDEPNEPDDYPGPPYYEQYVCVFHHSAGAVPFSGNPLPDRCGMHVGRTLDRTQNPGTGKSRWRPFLHGRPVACMRPPVFFLLPVA